MVSFSTTDERVSKIDSLVKTGMSPDRSTFINTSIDFYMRHIETKYLSDFIYYIGFPFLALVLCVGFTMIFLSWFFYLITIMIGAYLIILIFLFYKKYRGRVWQKDK